MFNNSLVTDRLVRHPAINECSGPAGKQVAASPAAAGDADEAVIVQINCKLLIML